MFQIVERGTLVKTFQVIEALAVAEGDVSLRDIAASAALPKPTAHRLLNDLTKLGYVSRSSPGAYRLTDKFRNLGADPGHRRLIQLAKPILQDLHQSVGRETVNLAVPRRDKIVYIAVIQADHALQRLVSVNEMAPYHTSALGQCILAHLSPARQEHLLARTRLKPATPATIVDADAFRAMLQQVRQQGFSLELNQADQGVGCAAAPVFDQGDPIAAISTSVPLARVDETRLRALVPKVVAAGAELTRLMEQEKQSE